MKEIKLNLTRQGKEAYSKSKPQLNRGGDISMATEPGQGDQPPRPISQEEATRRLEEAARQREQGRTKERQATEAGDAGGSGREPPAPPLVGGTEEQPPQPEGQPSSKETIAKAGITEPQLLNYIGRINELIDAGEPPREILSSGLKAIMGIEGVSEQEKNEVLTKIQEAFNNAPEPRREGLYGERKLTPSEKRQIVNATSADDIEKLFNRMFDRVDARPQADFTEAFGNAGTFEFEEFMKTLNEEITANNEKGNVARSRELNLIVQQFANEKKAREVIHNAYFGVMSGVDTDGMSKFIDAFQSGWADLAFSKAGVTQAMHFYEQALLVVREKAGGYLRPKEVVGEMKKNSRGEVNELSRKYLEEANSKGRLKGPSGKALEPWEIDRALSFARGMSIITGRTIEIAASSILPPGSAFTDQYAQRIIGELAPFRHSYKFFVGSKFSRILAYTMDRRRKPWTTKDIEDYANLKFEEQINVLNAMVPDGQERFYGVLNPFEIGGILSRTGWRIAGGGVTIIDNLVREKIEEMKGIELPDTKIQNIRKRIEEENKSKKTSIDKINELVNNEIASIKKKIIEDEAWIGTGVQIERKRGAFVRKEKLEDPVKARENAENAAKGGDSINNQLNLIAERTPLRLFLNIRSVQEKVLDKTAERLKMPKEKLKELMSQTRDRDKPEDTENREKAEKFLQWVDELVLLQEEANQNKKPLNEFLPKVSSDIQNYVKDIRDVWTGGEKKTFLKTLEEKEWKVPYTFGTDDVPYNEYDFEVTGPRSVARRWGDMASAARASKAFSELLTGIEHFKEQGQIVEAMNKIYEGIKGYNEDDARKFTLKLAEGIIKFYEKGWQHRLPLGIGSLMGALTGKSSYAQIAYGRGAMAWDELQINEFTRLLRDNGMLDIEQQHKLQEKAGGGKKEVVWGYTRTVLPLIMLALAYYMFTKVTKEERS